MHGAIQQQAARVKQATPLRPMSTGQQHLARAWTRAARGMSGARREGNQKRASAISSHRVVLRSNEHDPGRWKGKKKPNPQALKTAGWPTRIPAPERRKYGIDGDKGLLDRRCSHQHGKFIAPFNTGSAAVRAHTCSRSGRRMADESYGSLARGRGHGGTAQLLHPEFRGSKSMVIP